jgi:hypothetical protein
MAGRVLMTYPTDVMAERAPDHANSSAPACVDLTELPFSCSKSQPSRDSQVKSGLVFGRRCSQLERYRCKHCDEDAARRYFEVLRICAMYSCRRPMLCSKASRVV